MSDGSVRILKEGGSKLPVTFANKDEWVTLAADARLNESAVQLLAIRRGMIDSASTNSQDSAVLVNLFRFIYLLFWHFLRVSCGIAIVSH